MNKNQLNIFKTLLFFAGLLIVGAIFYLTNYPLPEEGLTVYQKFFWVEMVVCYLVFFVPFFFSSLSSKNVDTKMTSTTLIWICSIVFDLVAIILAILSLNEIVPIKTSILIELILAFIAGIVIYFGYFAGNHIGEVQAAETKSLNKIAELKTAFDMLSLKTAMWSEEYIECKNQLKKICDDVKYMSPVDTEMAASLESKLIIEARVIAEANFSPAELGPKLLNLANLVNQRKLLRK